MKNKVWLILSMIIKYSLCILLVIQFTGCNQNNYADISVNKEKEMVSSPIPTSKEEQIYKSLLQRKEIWEDIIKDFGVIDWTVYNTVSNKKAMELLNFIDANLDLIEDNQIPEVFKATKNLDGMYEEKYSVIVSHLFFKDKTKYFKILSSFNIKKIQEINKYVTFNFNSSETNIIHSDLNALYSSSSMSDKEKITIKNLLEYLDK